MPRTPQATAAAGRLGGALLLALVALPHRAEAGRKAAGGILPALVPDLHGRVPLSPVVELAPAHAAHAPANPRAWALPATLPLEGGMASFIADAAADDKVRIIDDGWSRVTVPEEPKAADAPVPATAAPSATAPAAPQAPEAPEAPPAAPKVRIIDDGWSRVTVPEEPKTLDISWTAEPKATVYDDEWSRFNLAAEPKLLDVSDTAEPKVRIIDDGWSRVTVVEEPEAAPPAAPKEETEQYLQKIEEREMEKKEEAASAAKAAEAKKEQEYDSNKVDYPLL